MIEYKDQTPRAATLDNPRIFREGAAGRRRPGVGEHPRRRRRARYPLSQYGSGRSAWAELSRRRSVTPRTASCWTGAAVEHRRGAAVLSEVSGARRESTCPDGRVPRPGDRFVNRDYAATLRDDRAGGRRHFYRGAVARRIAADMEANGGLITLDDLAQYRASSASRCRALSRSRPLHGRAAGRRRRLAARGAADPRQLRGAAGGDVAHRRRLLASRIEAWKVRDRITRIADPAHWAVDYERTSSAHAADLFARIRRMRRPVPGGPEEAAGGRRAHRQRHECVRRRRRRRQHDCGDADAQHLGRDRSTCRAGSASSTTTTCARTARRRARTATCCRSMRSNTANVPTLVFRSGRTGDAASPWVGRQRLDPRGGLLDHHGAHRRRPADAACIEAPRFLVARDPADAWHRRAGRDRGSLPEGDCSRT